MITKIKPVYYCEHCKKVGIPKHGLSRYKMEYHERICFYNPENKRACIDCFYIEKKEVEVAETINGGYQNIIKSKRTMNLFFCEKKQIFLHPPKVEIKGNAKGIVIDNEIVANEPMPKVCADFKEIDISKNVF